MNGKLNTLLVVVIVAAELGSVGLAATSASAQSATQTQRQIIRQQQLILQQQKQIQENQRLLDSQQRQLGRGTAAAAPVDLNRGIFGNIGNCPPGYTYNLFNGCLPTVVVLH